MKKYKEFYFESVDAEHFVVLSQTEHMVLGYKTQELANYISKNFLEILNFMCDHVYGKYEDWKDVFFINKFGDSLKEEDIKILHKDIYNEVEQAFIHYDGKCKEVNEFLAENMIDMLQTDFQSYQNK